MSYNLSRLIESLVEEVIDEAAKTAKEAQSQSLALVSGKTSSSTFAILFDWRSAFSSLEKEIKEAFVDEDGEPQPPTKKELKQLISDELPSIVGNSVTGFIQYSKASGCGAGTYNVDLSAASNKFGPLMYDYALSLAYPNYLTPDRDSVSNDASNVWNYYLKQRKDVEKELLPKLGKGCAMPVTKKSSDPNAVAQDKLKQYMDRLVEFKEDLKYYEERLTVRKSKKESVYEAEQMELIKKEISELTKVINKLEKSGVKIKEDSLEGNPLAYRYKITKPLATAGLAASSNKFLDAIYTKYGYKVSMEDLRYSGVLFFKNKHDSSSDLVG